MMNNGRDGKSPTAPCDDVDTTLSEEQKAACRRVVAAHAQGDTLAEMAADAEELMKILGVYPNRDGPFVSVATSLSTVLA